MANILYSDQTDFSLTINVVSPDPVVLFTVPSGAIPDKKGAIQLAYSLSVSPSLPNTSSRNVPTLANGAIFITDNFFHTNLSMDFVSGSTDPTYPSVNCLDTTSPNVVGTPILQNLFVSPIDLPGGATLGDVMVTGGSSFNDTAILQYLDSGGAQIFAESLSSGFHWWAIQPPAGTAKIQVQVTSNVGSTLSAHVVWYCTLGLPELQFGSTLVPSQYMDHQSLGFTVYLAPDLIAGGYLPQTIQGTAVLLVSDGTVFSTGSGLFRPLATSITTDSVSSVDLPGGTISPSFSALPVFGRIATAVGLTISGYYTGGSTAPTPTIGGDPNWGHVLSRVNGKHFAAASIWDGPLPYPGGSASLSTGAGYGAWIISQITIAPPTRVGYSFGIVIA